MVDDDERVEEAVEFPEEEDEVVEGAEECEDSDDDSRRGR